MIKVPGTEAGLPAIEELTRRGDQRQRHPALRDRALRAGDRRLPARARRARRRRRAARRDRVGRVVLPLAHRHQGRRAARRRLAAARPGRDRQRPRRLPALPGQVHRPRVGAPARVSARARSARCGRAPAPRTRPTPTSSTSPSSSVRTSSTRCPSRRSARSPTTATSRARSTPTPRRRSRRCADAAAAGIELAAITAELEREGVAVLLRLVRRAARLHRGEDPRRDLRTLRTLGGSRSAPVGDR